MTDDRFEEWLKEASHGYNAPPGDVPREAMWSAIAETRRAAGARSLSERDEATPARRPAWWGLALAAGVVLTAGIGIGYWMRGGASRSIAATTPAAAPDTSGARGIGQSTPYDVAAVQHFSAAEALLTSYRASAPDSSDVAVRRWARDLLSTTRLLLDSPASTDPRRRQLLEDLELILAQIVQLPPDAPASDRESISRSILREQVLTRIRTSIPAGLPAGT